MVYSDVDMKSINELPLTQLHKNVDDYIFKNNTGFDSLIICPPTIYGIGTGPFHRSSVQMPAWIRVFSKLGHAGTVGKGENYWNCVHVQDIADFYIFILDQALDGKADVGENGWYFCETGEYQLKEATEKVAESMVKYGLLKKSKIDALKKEEVDKEYGEIMGWIVTGGNSRCKAERGRKLGWKENGKFGSIFDSAEDEVKKFVEEQKKV